MKKIYAFVSAILLSLCAYASKEQVSSNSVTHNYTATIVSDDSPLEYTIVAVYLPTFNQPEAVEIIGGFDGWEGTAMEQQNNGCYFVEIEAKSTQYFKFRSAGSWAQELEIYNSADDTWNTIADNQLIFGQLWEESSYNGVDCKRIELDFSDPTLFRWTGRSGSTCGKNLMWSFDPSTGALVITGNGAMYDFEDIYNGTNRVGCASPWYNFVGNITSVSLPQGITTIGQNAFADCTSLTSVIIPNSVTDIGSRAFYGCNSLSSATIPNSVTYIGSSAFYGCTGLTSVQISDITSWCTTNFLDATSNPLYYAQNLYVNGDLLTELVIPDNVTSIKSYAFHGCSGLTSLTIPNSVTDIGIHAFYGCLGLNYVTIPNSVTYIGSGAFDGCTNLTDIYVTCGDDLYRVFKLLNYDNRVKYIPLPYDITINASNGTIRSPQNSCDALELTAIPDYGYHFTQWSDGNTENPRTIILTQDTTFTAEFAVEKSGFCGDNLALRWEYDDNSKSLTISGSGTLNSNYTFGLEAPNAVEKLVIAEGVTSIGNSAFAKYSTLKHLSVAASVKTIHEQAFYNCTGLEEIYCYRATPPTAYSNTFDGIEKFECVLHVLSASVNMYKAATGWRDFYYVQTIDAVEVTELITDVTVVPTDNTAEVTWPAVEQAATYTIVISKDGVVFCTLIFNANGQLQGIAFAPSRNDNHHAPAAVKTSNGGLRFTVTGLDSGTNYHLTLNTKDSDDQVIASYTSNFTTSGTGIEDVKQDIQAQKLLRNGKILILRGDRTYTVTGQEIK